jgi:hypothetical protein
MESVTLRTNSTDFNHNVLQGGGAIWSEGGMDSIENTRFQNNSVAFNGNGGALQLDNGGWLGSLLHTDFVENKAQDGDGGAFFIASRAEIGLIESSSFLRNEGKDGGVGEIDGKILLISNSTFENNTATEVNLLIRCSTNPF